MLLINGDVSPSELPYLLDAYERDLAQLKIEPQSLPEGMYPPNRASMLAHCMAMIPRMRPFLVYGRIGKFCRWQGFLYGVFWSEGVFTIDQMVLHQSIRVRLHVEPGMPMSKVSDVLSTYRTRLGSLGIKPFAAPSSMITVSRTEKLGFCLHLIPQIELAAKAEEFGTVYIWLGFINGVLTSEKIYTLKQIKDLSRPETI